jgi:cytochrome c553
MSEHKRTRTIPLSQAPWLACALLAAIPVCARAAPPEFRSALECTVCHGTEGLGNAAIGAPNISLLEPWYLGRQLEAYRAGYRGTHPDDVAGAEMQPIAAAVPQTAVDAILTDIARFESRPSPATIEADAARGRALYAPCARCHGDTAEGNRELGGPRLAGQNDWYLARQLRAYRSGWRGTSTGDRWGAQMRPFAMALPDTQSINDIVSYIASLAAASGAPTVSGIERVPLPGNSTFPIASMVKLGPGTAVIYHSGLTPRPADPDADPDSRAYYGDTETQARSVFERMKSSLESVGLGMGDVVKMTAFLVGDPAKGGAMDFAGFMAAYTEYFGTAEQPNLPARSAVQVAGLVNPRMLVEIEVIVATTAEE